MIAPSDEHAPRKELTDRQRAAIVRRSAAFASRRKFRELKSALDVVEMPPVVMPEQTNRRERKVNQLIAREWRCGCGRVEINLRKWHFFKGRKPRDPMCLRCWMGERDKRRGRPRHPEVPMGCVCPACGLIKPHRRQWNLKLGLCRLCVHKGRHI